MSIYHPSLCSCRREGSTWHVYALSVFGIGNNNNIMVDGNNQDDKKRTNKIIVVHRPNNCRERSKEKKQPSRVGTMEQNNEIAAPSEQMQQRSATLKEQEFIPIAAARGSRSDQKIGGGRGARAGVAAIIDVIIIIGKNCESPPRTRL